MTRFFRKYIIRFFIFTVISIFSVHNVMAGCNYTYSQSYFNETINFGNVIVQRDVPLGSILASVTKNPTSSYSNMYICSDAWIISQTLGIYSQPSSLGSPVYATNISGVGLKIVNDAGVTLPVDRQLGGQTAYGTSHYMTFLLIKTPTESTNNSGPLNPGPLAYWQANGVNFAQFNIEGNNNIVPVACSLQTPGLVFSIGRVPASDFGSAVGTIPEGANSTQNLGLDCDPKANINVSLNGTQNPDVGDNSVLALTGQGSSDVASGVGVQILYNNTPLKLNERIVLKKSAGGIETFPLIARYYQTKSTVKTGTANTSATLSVTYQ